MKIITLANQKGGTGKSTIAANLSCTLSNDGYKVLAIDSDTQNSLADFHAIRSEKLINERGSFSTIKIVTPVLHKEARKFNDFDIVVIDTGGRHSKLFSSAISAADILIVPITPSPYDLWASEETFKVSEEIRTYNQNLCVYVLLNMVIEKTIVAKEMHMILEKLIEQYNLKLFKTGLHNLVLYKYAVDEGLSVCERDKNSKACEEFSKFYEEVKNLLKS